MWCVREGWKRTAGDPISQARFGTSLSLDGDFLLIARPGDRDNGYASGGAYLFVRDGSGVWAEHQKLTASDGQGGDRFGASVSLSGDLALIGAALDDDDGYDSGSAYVFLRDGAGVWNQEQKLTRGVWSREDDFGGSVSLDGDTAVIGAKENDGIDLRGGYAQKQGSAYVFRLSTIGPDGDGASDVWESIHGFDPDVAYDFETQDSDGDGEGDLLEIFQFTDANSNASRHGLIFDSAHRPKQMVKARYRRSSSYAGVRTTYLWSPDLWGWYQNGAIAEGMKVEFSEEVVETGPGYEIVELAATVTLGSTDQLYVRIEVAPAM